MPSTITIMLDAQGNATVGPLPPGVFHSIFATPPDAQIRDVISINAGDSYSIVIVTPALTGASVEEVVEDMPLTLVGQTATTATFAVDADQLPELQEFGLALCQLAAASFSLGVIVNPQGLSVPVGLDIDGTITVDQDDVPVGVHFVLAQQKVSVWAAGGYAFPFALSPDQPYRFEKVDFDDPSQMFTAEISDDKLTAWIFNNNLVANSGVAVSFEFYCGVPNAATLPRVIVDPTIINNPINQGGDGLPGGTGKPVPRLELTDALVH
ncbi:MAG TPA: hypothetical protein VIE43_20100 [Thermoanaerobaculia bacterium]|jgi:hypothetical protein|nr:hypothetical protein [Thermoanaerobaculia bacterium]